MGDNQNDALLSLLKDFSSQTDEEQREILARLTKKEITKILAIFLPREPEHNPYGVPMKVVHFLSRCAGLLSNNHNILVSEHSNSAPNSATKANLTTMIQSRLYKIKTNNIENVQERMSIARELKQLYDVFSVNEGGKRTSKSKFYEHCKQSFNFSNRTCTSYLLYLNFHQKYIRFQQVPISFTEWRNSSSAVISWFNTEDCSKFHSSNYLSVSFWTKAQNQNHASEIQLSNLIPYDTEMPDVHFHGSSLDFQLELFNLNLRDNRKVSTMQF